MKSQTEREISRLARQTSTDQLFYILQISNLFAIVKIEDELHKAENFAEPDFEPQSATFSACTAKDFAEYKCTGNIDTPPVNQNKMKVQPINDNPNEKCRTLNASPNIGIQYQGQTNH